MLASAPSASVSRPASSVGQATLWPVVIAGALGLWLLARPYIGVRHDGILYLGQIYAQLAPEVFSHDFFFAFGSQDKFSIYSKLGAWLLTTIGLGPSQFVTLILSQVVLLSAAAWLMRGLQSLTQRLLGLAALAVMPHFYGGMSIFAFAETFVTARTLAEPLALLALAALVHGWRKLAFLSALAAASMHPLMLLPVAVVGWIWLAHENRRWAWLALPMLAAIVSLALIGVAPFTSLLARYDDAWLSVVQVSNPFVFPGNWAVSSWSLTLGVLMFLTWGTQRLPARLHLLARATALATLLLLLLSTVASDWAHNVLLTQLQLWRALWIAHLLAILVLPAVLIDLWSRGREWQAAALALLAAAVALTSRWPSGGLVAAWAVALCALAHYKPVALQSSAWTLIRMASAAVLTLLSALILAGNFHELSSRGVSLDWSLWLWGLVSTPALTLGLAWGMLGSSVFREYPLTAGAALAALLLLAGASLWDRRTDTQRVFEARPATPHPFTLKTSPSSQIYWRDSLTHTWAMLGRASYFVDQQGSGVLFERKTAMEFERRRHLMAPLSLQREVCMMLAGLEGKEEWSQECVPDLALVADICAAAGGPDYLVFPFALARGAVQSWTLAPQHGKTTTYYLHDCTLLH